MSSYLEVKAVRVKSWEEEQLMSLNKVVKDLQDEVQYAKQNEVNTKKKLSKLLGKNKKVQETVKRLTGEKEELVQENIFLSNKIDTLEKEVKCAHNSTINETSHNKTEDIENLSSETVDTEEELTTNEPKNTSISKEGKQEEVENNQALKMLEDIKLKMDTLTSENSSLKEELEEYKEKNRTYQEGMVLIKDCFGDANKSFKEEKNDFIQIFVQSIMESVGDLKSKVEELENDCDTLNDHIAQKEAEISDQKSEIEEIKNDFNQKKADFESNLDEIKVQKSRIEKAFDQLQSDLNDTLLKNQNLENEITETNMQLENERKEVENLREEKSNLTKEKQEMQVDLNAERTQLKLVQNDNDQMEEKCKQLEECIAENKKTIEVLQGQMAINTKLNSDLESQLKRSRAHSQSVESENYDLKKRCEKLEDKVEKQSTEVENEREALKATMRSVEDVLLDKQNQMKEMREAVSSVSCNNNRLLAQVEDYRKTILRLEEERDEMKLKIEDLKKAFYLEANALRKERDEMSQELEVRLEVAQRTSEEVLKNEQEMKDQLQNSYVERLLKAEHELRQKDRALEEAHTSSRRNHNMSQTDNSLYCSLKDTDAFEDLEFQLELTRETGAENLRHERKMRDQIQTSYIEKLLLTQEILQQKEEMLATVEQNFEKLKTVNKKLVDDNIQALEKIKELTKAQQKSEKLLRMNSSHRKESGSYRNYQDTSDSYENLLEKLEKLENHLATCAENSASERTRDYHLCKLDNIHLDHQNRSLKKLLIKVKSVTGLDDQDLASLQKCSNDDNIAIDGGKMSILDKINSLDRQFRRFELEFYDETEELRRDYAEARRLNEMYERELRSMARRHGVPVMLQPMYSGQYDPQHDEDDDEEGEEEYLESTRIN